MGGNILWDSQKSFGHSVNSFFSLLWYGNSDALMFFSRSYRDRNMFPIITRDSFFKLFLFSK